MGRKRSKMYFGQQTQDKIKQYILQSDPKIKQRIYQKDIYPAFKRIAQALVHKYKIQQRLQSSEVMQLQCITDMTQKIHDFDVQRGKAFSFFTTLARNFVLTQLDEGIRHNYKFKSINEVNAQGQQINFLQDCSLLTWENHQEKRKSVVIIQNTINQLSIQLERQLIPKLKKKQQVQIVYAVIQLMKDASILRNFNKKAIMLYIRQMTDANNDTINVVLKKIAKYYFKVKSEMTSQLFKYQYLIGIGR